MTCSPRFRTSLMSELIPSPSLQMSPSTAPQSGWRSISSDLRWPWVALTMRRWDNSVLAWSGATCFELPKLGSRLGTTPKKVLMATPVRRSRRSQHQGSRLGRSDQGTREDREDREERNAGVVGWIKSEMNLKWSCAELWLSPTWTCVQCTAFGMWKSLGLQGQWLHMVAHGCTWLHMVAHGCTWLHWENQCLWEVPCDYCTCNMCHVLRTMTECLMREFAAQFKKSLSCIPLKSCGMRSPFVSCPEESGLRSFVQQESCLQVGGEKQTMSFRELN